MWPASSSCRTLTQVLFHTPAEMPLETHFILRGKPGLPRTAYIAPGPCLCPPLLPLSASHGSQALPPVSWRSLGVPSTPHSPQKLFRSLLFIEHSLDLSFRTQLGPCLSLDISTDHSLAELGLSLGSHIRFCRFSSVGPLCELLSLHIPVLVWLPPEAHPETRIQMQVVYMGRDPRE